jgi:hypothetical protein
MMTELLERAFAQASKLSAEEQDTLAAWIIEELASERRWERTFADSGEVLARLADEALAEHRGGRTESLD